MPRGSVASAGRHRSSGRPAATNADYTPRHAPAHAAPLYQSPSPRPAPRTPRSAQGRRARSGRRRFGTTTTVLLAIVASLLIKMFVLQAFLIPSGSMENTLRVGDRVLTNRLSYELHGIHRGDVVVFSGAGTWNGPAPASSSSLPVRWWHDLAVRAGIESPAGTIYVKRVIGLPGDTVACCNASGQVTVNGVGLDESSYVYQDSYWAGSCPQPPDGISPRCFGPVKVAPGMLWVMGDHRNISEDSRRHLDDPGGGAVDSSQVVGKAVLVLWPLAHWHSVGTPTTFAGVPAVAMVTLPYWRRRRRGARRRRVVRRRAGHDVP